MKALKVGLLVLLAAALSSCGGKKFTKSPVDEIVKDIPPNRVFSVVLYDMDVEGSFFREYKHQYRIIQESEPGKPEEELTGWYDVSKTYFERHVDNMGMEIAWRGEDGKLQKGASPQGYNHYVGNPRYGSWQSSGGSSFWAFYGQYAFMNSMFNLMTYPARRSYYNDYRGTYYGTGKPYYGPRTSSGRTTFGTSSDYSRTTNRNSKWSRNTSSFKQRVASRTSRSSSRYGGSSSSRSRGGGFGK